MAEHHSARRCTSAAVESIGAALCLLGEARDRFDRLHDCDGACDHDPPADLFADLDAADRALVSALATCTAALNRELQDQEAA